MALSDPQGILASPLTIINRTDEKADIEAIINLIRQNQVGRVIAGLPISMDGSQGKQAEKVKAFVTALCRRPMFLWNSGMSACQRYQPSAWCRG